MLICVYVFAYDGVFALPCMAWPVNSVFDEDHRRRTRSSTKASSINVSSMTIFIDDWFHRWVVQQTHRWQVSSTEMFVDDSFIDEMFHGWEFGSTIVSIAHFVFYENKYQYNCSSMTLVSMNTNLEKTFGTHKRNTYFYLKTVKGGFGLRGWWRRQTVAASPNWIGYVLI